MTDHIKIHGITPRIQYVANGILSDYSFPFAIFKTQQIRVYFGSSLVPNTSYTVHFTPTEEGGTISFNTPPENETIITITRHLDIERTSDFQEGGSLRSDTLNNELDYQIACQQQIADTLNRSMVLPPYAVDTDVDFTLPLPEPGKSILWSADGKSLENSTVEVNNMIAAIDERVAIATDKANVATTAASTATEKASVTIDQAGIATTQATIAATKAQEAATTLNNKANTSMDNLTTTGKETVVNLVMPGYFVRGRDNLISGVWNYANKDVLVTVNLTINLQGGIFISPDGGVSAAQAIRCVAPSSGGYSGCSAFIRKGLYYQAISNHEAYVDYLMGE